jgi:hypothetical protein
MGLSYRDMESGAIACKDIANDMNKFLKFEIGIMYYLCAVGLFHQDYFFFLFCTPVIFYNTAMLAKGDLFYDPITVL